MNYYVTVSTLIIVIHPYHSKTTKREEIDKTRNGVFIPNTIKLNNDGALNIDIIQFKSNQSVHIQIEITSFFLFEADDIFT